MGKLTGFRHWLFGCRGYVDRERDADGIWWIGLRCHHCGDLKSKGLSMVQDTPAGLSALEASQ